jgi:hypothetical protein
MGYLFLRVIKIKKLKRWKMLSAAQAARYFDT